MTTPRIIFYEINEVPLRVFQAYAERFPRSAVARMMNSAKRYETLTPDTGHLSPWITWPTLHRGVSNQIHQISDFGQDLSEINRKYPNYFDILAQQGVSVGVFGSLHTCPLPRHVARFSFYVPDTFANNPATQPYRYQSFQKLNLRMTAGNGRNISRQVPIREAIDFAVHSPALGVSARTVGKIIEQLYAEHRNPARVIRRRTTQAQLSFDLFHKALKTHKPQLATFFTNHIASSMHRYWPASFPEDYESFSMPEEWRTQYSGEIWAAMHESNHHLDKLLSLVGKSPEYTLVIAGSMGQAAMQNSIAVSTQLLLTRPDKLMTFCGIAQNTWVQQQSMVPYYTFQLASQDDVKRFLAAFDSISICDQAIKVRDIGAQTISVHFGQVNIDLKTKPILRNNAPIDCGDIGLEIVDIQDKSASYAYHVPEGVMFVCNGHTQENSQKRIITTQIAPSILANFNVPLPGYMTEPLKVF